MINLWSDFIKHLSCKFYDKKILKNNKKKICLRLPNQRTNLNLSTAKHLSYKEYPKIMMVFCFLSIMKNFNSKNICMYNPTS